MLIGPERFQSGLTYQEFVAQADLNRERLERTYRDIRLAPSDLQAFRGLSQPLKVVAISEDWAADAVVSLPLLARLAEESGKLDLRVFLRDQNPDLMDQYLKEGKYRTIPVFAFFDAALQRQVAVYQERPATLNEMHRDVVGRFVELHPNLKDEMAKLPEDRPEDVKRVYRGWVSEEFAKRREDIQVEVVRELRRLLGAEAVKTGGLMSQDQVPLYDRFSREYDVMVAWEGRLNREWPFLEARLKEVGAQRVLDVGTGTGMHSIWLARHGYQALGTDPSQEMLAQARRNAGDTQGVRFAAASLGNHREAVGERFDAIFCLGNTLPHALTEADLLEALRDFRGVLRPGGQLLLQQLNYDRILATGQRFLGLSSGQGEAEEMLFFRFYDYPPGSPDSAPLTFNVAILQRGASGWTWRVESTQLQPIRAENLVSRLQQAGFADPRLYGSYDGEPFDAEGSSDLIVVAKAA